MSTIVPNRRAVILVCLMVLVDIIGLGIILPVTPELIMVLTGEGISQAARYGGWLWFSYALLQFFCAPLLGGLSDRYGRRPVLLFSQFAFGLDYLVMGFAPTLFWLFIGRAIAGAAGATYSAAYAFMADISPPEKRAQNFGLIGAAFGVGFILGPAVGGLLGELGPRAPFFVAGGLALSNAVFGYFILPESLAPEKRRAFAWTRANPLGTLLQMRKYPAVLGLAAALFLWQLGHQALPTTWSFYTIYKFGWSEAAVGGSLAFVGILMAVSQAGLARVVIPRWGERRTVLFGLSSGIAAFLGYTFATQGWMMYGWMLFWLLAALVYPSLNALMSQQVPADGQGELQGGVASLYSLASIAGPPLMTQLFGYFSSESAPAHFPGAPFLCAALLTLGSVILFLKAHRAVGGEPAPGQAPT